jgi:hypothetical protein
MDEAVGAECRAPKAGALRPDSDCAIYSKALSNFTPNPSGQTGQRRERNSPWWMTEQRLNLHPSNQFAPQCEQVTSTFHRIDWQTPEELRERLYIRIRATMLEQG